MTTTAWIRKNAPSLAGKTVAISGATGGLGHALCEHLAALGAHLVLCDRNPDKSHALGDRLQQGYPSLVIDYIPLDLTNMVSVHAAAGALEAIGIDALILNAGIYAVPRVPADSGYNNIFQINFVAPYILAEQLLPHLRRRGGRVVAVGSIAHTYSVTDPADVDFSGRTAASKIYGNAKRHLMAALTAEAAHGGIAITHPGITLTGITAHYPKWIFALIKYPMKVLFMSPRRASLSILQGVFTDCAPGEWIGPRWGHIWGLPKTQPLRTIPADEITRIHMLAHDMTAVLKETTPF